MMASFAPRPALRLILSPCYKTFVTTASKERGRLNPSTLMMKMAKKTAFFMQKNDQRVREIEKHKKPQSQNLDDMSSDKKGVPWSTQYLRDYTPRRAKVLESVLLDHISELLCSEEFFRELGEETVELTGVGFNRAHNVVNVLYVPKGDHEKDRLLYDKLRTISPEMRHQLCQQHILGHVPRLEFMPDKAFIRLQQIQEVLSKADMGPPVPSEEEEVLEINVEASPVSGVTSSIAMSSHDDWKLDESLVKRTDIAGLDREKILSSISPAPKSERRKKPDIIDILPVS